MVTKVDRGEIMRKFTLPEIAYVMKRKKYTIFEEDSKQYNLNLVGIRSNNITPGKFDDVLYVFWRYKGKWFEKHYKITTDPGLHYLKKPLNPLGTAILKPGQYKGMWAIGMHRGKYKALVQVKDVTVIRDGNKDNKLDFNAKKEQTGKFGINLHRALEDVETSNVGAHSAGCQVFANPDDFDEVIELCEKARDNFGNSFTYTLLEERDFV